MLAKHIHTPCDNVGFVSGDIPFPIIIVNAFSKFAGEVSVIEDLVHEMFIDIGVPEDYYRFCGWHQRGKLT